ncbi:hypothetical protein V1517DRAFT_370067 [Lipomyces orientalis]|uniref:Uncharacterized protein n=1 Tax=Lipomyces orientalis TaxID=1233043 RepID=A0ACC3TDZ1_9ASCO
MSAVDMEKFRQRTLIEHSELLDTVRRPISPDPQIEIQASRSEYERVQEILEEEGAKFPRLQYDGVRQAAIVSAAPSSPSPLHGVMIGQLLRNISRAVDKTPGLDENIRDRLSSTHDYRNAKDTGDTSTTKNLDGAVSHCGWPHVDDCSRSGSDAVPCSLRAAVSFSVCALRYRVGIAMAAIQEIKRALRTQLQASSFGPLKIGEDIWFDKVTSVVLETYRLEDETSLPDTLLNPTQSFKIVDDGRFVGDEVPANLAELTLGDCIPTYILRGNYIAATSVNFFHQDWFERRVEDKHEVQQV